MIAIELRFPSGRYHATPWNHHVNEGIVEWPPSPWRLLRALVATRFLKASSEVHDEQVTALLETLASDVPSYAVPKATAGHTRHYMPLFKDGTTKIFDAFHHVAANERLQIIWTHATLPESDRLALALLLRRMGYLGRAESWVEARLMEEDEATLAPNVEPCDSDEAVPSGLEIIRLLAPLPANELSAWRAQTFERELQRKHEEKRERDRQKGKDPDQTKLTPKDKKNVDATVPKSLAEALEVDTGTLRKLGWSAVPGARWMDYRRPSDLIALAPNRSPRRRRDLPTAARFAVASQLPPRLTKVVSMAERVRVALMSRSNGTAVFSGKDQTGAPLRGHPHALVLPEANGKHGRISHVTLFAPMGFNDDARRAMDGLRKVWGRGDHDVQLVLLGVGDPDQFAGLDSTAGECTLFARSSTWISRTPFVPTRHPKSTRAGQPKTDASGLQLGSAEHDVRRLIAEAGLPSPIQVEKVDATELGGKRTRWLEFKTSRRRGGGRRGPPAAAGFKLVFAEPVPGPIALGYGAHFGLGMFVPA